MYPKHLKNYIIYDHEDIYKAHWKLHKNGAILIVLDSDERYKGLITISDMARSYEDPTLSIRELCNEEGKCLKKGEDLYTYAKSMFAEYPFIKHIPVIDVEKNLSDILSRERVFWKQYYRENRLPRMYYAYCIWNAALEAKSLGYDSFSVIEFGVAGGNGLLNCEFHAKEIERILGINIEIYGFDSAEGLPVYNRGYKDMVHIWPAGSYHMDVPSLNDKLEKAMLVIGNIENTVDHFFTEHVVSPIGCMLIDVDYYSSTVPILKLLDNPEEYFLPRIQMYFDDIHPEYEFSGENLAIKEFNRNHKKIKISPEKLSYADHRLRTKVCHRFQHEKYNNLVSVFCGLELTPADYELHLKDFL